MKLHEFITLLQIYKALEKIGDAMDYYELFIDPYTSIQKYKGLILLWIIMSYLNTTLNMEISKFG